MLSNLFRLPREHVGQHAFFTLVKLICLALAIHYIFAPPAPGKAVVILAIAAGAASLQPNQEGWQKSLWIAVMCACTYAEFQSIKMDRASAQWDVAVQQKEQEREFLLMQEEQNVVLSTALDGFSNELNALQTMTRQIGEVAGTAEEAVNRLTGKGSTPCASFGADGLYADNALQLYVYNDGKYPLYNIDVEVGYNWKRRPPERFEISNHEEILRPDQEVTVLGNTPTFWQLHRVLAKHVFPVVHHGTPEQLHLYFVPEVFDDGTAGSIYAIMRTQNGVFSTAAEIRPETEYMKGGVFNPAAVNPWDLKYSTTQEGPGLGGRKGYVGFKRLKTCDSKGWTNKY